MGRPKNPDSARYLVSARVTEATHDDIDLVAQMLGKTVSDYIRDLITNDITDRKSRPDWEDNRTAVVLARIELLKARLAAIEQG